MAVRGAFGAVQKCLALLKTLTLTLEELIRLGQDLFLLLPTVSVCPPVARQLWFSFGSFFSITSWFTGVMVAESSLGHFDWILYSPEMAVKCAMLMYFSRLPLP